MALWDTIVFMSLPCILEQADGVEEKEDSLVVKEKFHYKFLMVDLVMSQPLLAKQNKAKQGFVLKAVYGTAITRTEC